ncbi:uncharacterized protein TNCV_3798491 [Trichonephila clavipes]|nr:uncharacterized protein TNCV_3798491 [Trichonephila clavipes]
MLNTLLTKNITVTKFGRTQVKSIEPRAASPLVWLVEGVERWEALKTPGVLPQNWNGNEPNRTVTCMVLKATANDRRHLTLCHDEFRGHRSGLCRSGGISNNYKQTNG